MAWDVAGLVVKLAPEGIKATTDQLKDFTKQAGRAEDAAEDLAKGGKAAEQAMFEFGAKVDHVRGGPLTALNAALVAAPVMLAARKFIDFGASVVKVGAQFEVLAAQMTAVMGSESEAAKALTWIDDFTLKTPLQVEQVAESFNMMKAIGIDPMAGALQAVVDATSFTAQGYEGLIGVTRQLGQAWAKERLAGEEVLRLRERMIPVYDLLAAKMGKTTKEIAVMSEKGELGRKEIQLLLEAMGEKYAGAAALQMNTLTGQISNLQQTIQFAFREISKGGLLEAVKKGVADIAEEVNKMVASGRLADIGKGMGDVFAAFTEKVPDILELFAKFLEYLPAIIDHLDEAAKILVTMWAIDEATTFLNLITKLTPALGAATTKAWGLYGALGAIVGIAIAEWADSLFRELEDEPAQKLRNFQEAMVLAFGEGGMRGVLRDFGSEAVGMTEALRAAFEHYEKEVNRAGGAIGQWAKLQTIFNAIMGETKKATVTVTAGVGDVADTFEDAGEKAVGSAEALAAVDRAFERAERAAADLRETLIDATDMTGEFSLQLDDVSEGAFTLGDDLTDLGQETQFTLVPALERAAGWFLLTGKAVENLKPKLTAAQAAVAEFSNEFKQSIVDLFGEGFKELIGGTFDNVLDLFQDFALRLAETIVRTFIDRLIASKGDFLGTFSDLFGTGIGEGGIFGGAMLGIAGAGMLYSGYQQGGAGGALTGALGGAMMGTMIYPGLGTIIGAVVGGLAGLFGGGGDESPHIKYRFGPETGFGVYGSGGAIQFGDPQRRVWEQGVNKLYEDTQAAYRDLIRLFEMPELFELIDTLESVDFGRVEMTPQDLAKWIEDVWLPEAMDTMFGRAIKAGLEGLGMDTPTIRALMEELEDLPGGERLDALLQVVGVLRGATEMLGQTFEELQARVQMGTIDAFSESISDALDAIELLQTGWEHMSLLERAQDLEQIGAIFQQVTQNTLQMLSQIQAVSDSVNQSFDRMREAVTLQGMTPGETVRYAMAEIDELMQELGGATTPEQVARLSAEIQRYLQVIQGSGVELDQMIGWSTYREYIFEKLDEAQALANQRLGEMEDLVRQRYEETQAAFEAATDAVLHFAEAVSEWEFPWPQPPGAPEGEYDPTSPEWQNWMEQWLAWWNQYGGMAMPGFEDLKGILAQMPTSSQFETMTQAVTEAVQNPPVVNVYVQGDLAALTDLVEVAVYNATREIAAAGGLG